MASFAWGPLGEQEAFVSALDSSISSHPRPLFRWICLLAQIVQVHPWCWFWHPQVLTRIRILLLDQNMLFRSALASCMSIEASARVQGPAIVIEKAASTCSGTDTSTYRYQQGGYGLWPAQRVTSQQPRHTDKVLVSSSKPSGCRKSRRCSVRVEAVKDEVRLQSVLMPREPRLPSSSVSVLSHF